MGPRYRFRPRVIPLRGARETGRFAGSEGCVDRLLAVLGDRPGSVALDSSGGRGFSVLAFDPLAEVGPGSPVRDLAGLRAFHARLEAVPGDAVPGPFHGGFLGALAYELGIAGERLDLPAHPWGPPPVVGGLYCDFVVVDHRAPGAWLVLGEEPGDGRAPWTERRDALLARLASSRDGADPAPRRAAGVELRRRVPAADHCARIERLREWIGAGELYQANLAHAFGAQVDDAPLDLYRRLRRVNPAPHAGFLRWRHGESEGAILSASPELLVELAGRSARTRPIKGTIARGTDAASDGLQRARLLASEKDLAELAMIVDLERNDLGRVARVGSVRVEGFPTLESYAAVHHLVADVVAELREGVDAFDLLAALFPGGSITGAPKIASMRAIAQLEGEGRGFFTGSMGFVDTRGHAAFNILIRTLVWRPRDRRPALRGTAGEVLFHVGGGITWSSDARAEERETLDKGSALAAALAPDGEMPAGFGALAPLWSRESPPLAPRASSGPVPH